MIGADERCHCTTSRDHNEMRTSLDRASVSHLDVSPKNVSRIRLRLTRSAHAQPRTRASVSSERCVRSAATQSAPARTASGGLPSHARPQSGSRSAFQGMPSDRAHTSLASSPSSQRSHSSACSMRVIASVEGGGSRMRSGSRPTRSANSVTIVGHVLKYPGTRTGGRRRMTLAASSSRALNRFDRPAIHEVLPVLRVGRRASRQAGEPTRAQAM